MNGRLSLILFLSSISCSILAQDEFSLSLEVSDWIQSIQSSSQSIKDQYETNAILFYQGIRQDLSVEEFWSQWFDERENEFRIGSAQCIVDRELVAYVTVELLIDNQNELKIFTVFEKAGSRWHRTLEWVENISSGVNAWPAIESQRQEWIRLCRTHQVDSLIKRMYTPDCFYYNRKRLIQGTDGLIEEYQYMANPNYELKLTPIQWSQINANTILEIGQCIGSYGGKYVLIWKRNTEGLWQIHFDTNY